MIDVLSEGVRDPSKVHPVPRIEDRQLNTTWDSSVVRLRAGVNDQTELDHTVFMGTGQNAAHNWLRLMKDTIAHQWSLTAYVQNLLKQSIGTLNETTSLLSLSSMAR